MNTVYALVTDGMTGEERDRFDRDIEGVDSDALADLVRW